MSKAAKIAVSFVLMLVSVPAGIFLELSANGCCGAPSTGFEGIGYVLMAVLFLAGLILFIATMRTKDN